jgi:hypothetical protein
LPAHPKISASRSALSVVVVFIGITLIGFDLKKLPPQHSGNEETQNAI